MVRNKVSPLQIVTMAANVMVVITVVAALYLAQGRFYTAHFVDDVGVFAGAFG